MDRAELYFAKAIDDLAGRMGVKLADMTAGEVFALARASERAADPFRGVNADLAGMPVKVCQGVYFWKLTVGASVWLDECVEPIWGEMSDRYRAALVYALINARDPGAFRGLETEAAIEKAVKRACLGISATPAEVNAALDKVLGIRVDAGGGDVSASATDWSRICRRLETQTGIPAEDWIWKHSADYLVKSYNDLHEFAQAMGGGGQAAHMRDELDAATEDLQKLKVKIMRRVGHGGTPPTRTRVGHGGTTPTRTRVANG